jgi:hypothetical protein
MARKVDEAANFVFVQFTEQELGIYDKRHPDYARQDKIGLMIIIFWEMIIIIVTAVETSNLTK